MKKKTNSKCIIVSSEALNYLLNYCKIKTNIKQVQASADLRYEKGNYHTTRKCCWETP